MGLHRREADGELLRERRIQDQTAHAPQSSRPRVRTRPLRERVSSRDTPSARAAGESRALVQMEMVMMNLAKTLPVRAPWNGFPEVVVHSSIYKLKSLPDYYAAKRGDDRAAARIAWELVRPEKIDSAVDFVVPVI